MRVRITVEKLTDTSPRVKARELKANGLADLHIVKLRQIKLTVLDFQPLNTTLDAL